MQFKELVALAFTPCLVLPFLNAMSSRSMMPLFIGGYFFLFFLIVIRGFGRFRVEQAAMTFLFSIFMSLFFSCGVYMRDRFGPDSGGLYLLVALGCAWLCDTGAFFVGNRFGKTKLSPTISPNKTVEGAVGGVLFAMVFMLLIAWGYQAVMAARGVAITVDWLALMIVTPLGAVIGMMGDLSASVIKRQFGVKDFGNFMPGHGGLLDRFDSALFTLPAVYFISRLLPIVS